jgi:hypothetical protein
MIELEPSFGHVFRVWWSYTWRVLLTLIGSMVIGFVIGFVGSYSLGQAGFSQATIQVILAPFCFLIGIGLSMIPIYSILGKDFGSFRVIIVSKEADDNKNA